MNRLTPQEDDDLDSMMWGPYENSNLALLLCSDPRQSLEEVIKRIYFDEDIVKVSAETFRFQSSKPYKISRSL